MKRFYDWLGEEAVGRKIWWYIFLFVIGNLIYCSVVIYLLQCIGVHLHERKNLGISFVTWSFFFLLLIDLAFEELFFRIPLIIPITLSWSTRAILLYAIPFSIVFGLLHGGFLNILIQGVAGFGLCILALKCGGLQGRPVRGFLVAYIAHVLFDITIFAIVFFQGTHTI